MITQIGAGDSARPSLVGRVLRWPLWAMPRLALCYILAVELVTLVLMGVTLAHTHITATDFGRFAVLGGLSIFYAEAADRVERFKRYLGSDRIWSNHTSVWAFAGVLLLPAAFAAVLVVVVYAHYLLLGHRRQSARPHRVVFVAATMVLATFAASGVLGLLGVDGLSSGLTAALATVGAFVIFPMTNLGVLLSGMALATKPPKMTTLLPDRDTIGFELMTLALGLVTAQFVLHTLWLAPVVLGVLAGLHRSSLVKELRVAAITDSKTGLLNIAAWQDQARQGLSRALRANQPVAVVMIDLDHFKQVNDTHGHLVGDRVLHEVATALGVELRGHDLLGRFGGEEFVAFLEGPSATAAAEISERLRHRIASLTSTDTVVVTASIGVAYCTHTRSATLTDLLQVADTGLYEAKSAGRNRVGITHLAAPIRQL